MELLRQPSKSNCTLLRRESTWEIYAGTGTAIGKELYYSKTYGTWMGRNFKVYKQTWGGNKLTGGKNKFGKATSKKIGQAGNALSIEIERQNGEINNTQWVLEQASNAFSILGGIYGAGWAVGWELGRFLTNNIECYQEFKFYYQYDRWEKIYGKPSESNDFFWNYFYENYGK